MSNELIVVRSIKIDAPPSQVWDALTNPEMTRQYMFGCDVISGWTIGSPVIWRGAADGKVYVKGNVIDIEPGRRLQYTVFDPNMGIADTVDNYLVVTYELTSVDDHTMLTVSQGDFATVANGEKRHADTLAGWDAVLSLLKALAEKQP
jgi:uncharacterized protein YndB with AHSA1/START domain